MKHFQASNERCDIKAGLIIMLSREGKNSSHPSRWNVQLSGVALMAGIRSLNTTLINIYTP